MTVNMQLVVVFHHSPCCIIIIIFFILSCIECIHVSWCTTVRNKIIIIIIIIMFFFLGDKFNGSIRFDIIGQHDVLVRGQGNKQYQNENQLSMHTIVSTFPK